MNTAENIDYVNRFRPSQEEIDRRYANVRAAMEAHGLDALVVSGSEYSGFEGAIRYLAGFHILHRYAYVVITANADPFIVFPREASWVGDHSATFLERELPARSRSRLSLKTSKDQATVLRSPALARAARASLAAAR